MTFDRARVALNKWPAIQLVACPTPIQELTGLREVLGCGPRLLIKRDDTISFAFGGNKVRKLEVVAAKALEDGADTLITAGGIQSNHARVTATTAAKLGMRCILVVNGDAPERPTGNALLDALVGAEVVYVRSPEERLPTIATIADRMRREGKRPFEIPIGASTPLGALGFARGLAELTGQAPPPDVIVHATSSGGTQAGLLAGCRLYGWPTRVIGVSADDPAPIVSQVVADLLRGIEPMLDLPAGSLASEIEVNDQFVGPGYAVPSAAGTGAIELAARTEGFFLDPTYTGKAFAGLLAMIRRGVFRDNQTVMFWHTGGQVALFA